jgi:hypothetical protein
MTRWVTTKHEIAPSPHWKGGEVKSGLMPIVGVGGDFIYSRRPEAQEDPDLLQAPEADMEGIRLPRCRHGFTLGVERFGELFEVLCLNHREEDATLVDEDDLDRWRLEKAAGRLSIKIPSPGSGCSDI